jgi:hypothetical protein
VALLVKQLQEWCATVLLLKLHLILVERLGRLWNLLVKQLQE